VKAPIHPPEGATSGSISTSTGTNEGVDEVQAPIRQEEDVDPGTAQIHQIPQDNVDKVKAPVRSNDPEAPEGASTSKAHAIPFRMPTGLDATTPLRINPQFARPSTTAEGGLTPRSKSDSGSGSSSSSNQDSSDKKPSARGSRDPEGITSPHRDTTSSTISDAFGAAQGSLGTVPRPVATLPKDDTLVKTPALKGPLQLTAAALVKGVGNLFSSSPVLKNLRPRGPGRTVVPRTALFNSSNSSDDDLKESMEDDDATISSRHDPDSDFIMSSASDVSIKYNSFEKRYDVLKEKIAVRQQTIKRKESDPILADIPMMEMDASILLEYQQMKYVALAEKDNKGIQALASSSFKMLEQSYPGHSEEIVKIDKSAEDFYAGGPESNDEDIVRDIAERLSSKNQFLLANVPHDPSRDESNALSLLTFDEGHTTDMAPLPSKPNRGTASKQAVSWEDNVFLTDDPIKGVSKDSTLLKTVTQDKVEEMRDAQEAVKEREEKRKTKGSMTTSYLLNTGYSISIDFNPSANCLHLMERILSNYMARHLPKDWPSIIAKKAMVIWSRAKAITFSDLSRIAKGLSRHNVTPYMTSDTRNMIYLTGLNQLIGHVRSQNLPESASLVDDDGIDPLSDDVVYEAWVIGWLVWIPAELGRRYNEMREFMDLFKAPFHQAVEDSDICKMIEEDVKIVAHFSQHYKGYILSKPCVLNYAITLDMKDSHTPEEKRHLEWFLMAQICEKVPSPKNYTFRYMFADDDIHKVEDLPTKYTKEHTEPGDTGTGTGEQKASSKPAAPTKTSAQDEPKSPTPHLKASTSDASKGSIPTTKSSPHAIPPPTSPPPKKEAKKEEQSTPVSANKKHKGPSDEDLVEENLHVTKPIPPGQMAPELRYPSVAPPDYATHFSGRYKALPTYDKGRYTGHTKMSRWVNYPSPLSWNQLPYNAKKTFLNPDYHDHWSNRTFYLDGFKYRTSEDGLSYWMVEEPSPPVEPEPAAPQTRNTPWTNKEGEPASRTPLRYEPAHQNQEPFKSDISSIKKVNESQASYYQQPRNPRLPQSDYVPFVSVKNLDEYKDRDFVKQEKDIRGWHYDGVSPTIRRNEERHQEELRQEALRREAMFFYDL
jgi:hypothetical protein